MSKELQYPSSRMSSSSTDYKTTLRKTPLLLATEVPKGLQQEGKEKLTAFGEESVNRPNLQTVHKEQINFEEEVIITSELPRNVEEMSIGEQENTDSIQLLDHVKVEMPVDNSSYSDLSDYAEVEDNGLNLTLIQHVKVELTVDEYNSDNEEMSVNTKGKSIERQSSTCNIQLHRNMEEVSISEQMITSKAQEEMAPKEPSVYLQNQEEIGNLHTIMGTTARSTPTNHKHLPGSKEVDKHTIEYAKKYAASLMGDPSSKLKRCGSSVSKVEKPKHSTKDTEERPFECKDCGKNFKKIKHLREHSLTHRNGQSYECEVCFKSFTQVRYLKQHFHSHTEERYECKDCGKSFLRIGYLKQHTHSHTGEKRYECKVCGKKFKDFSNHKRHSYIHTGERPYECDVCGKSFTQVYNLKQHLLTHSGIRPHECEICGKSFTQFHSLKLHCLIHTGERPHECNVCGLHFRVARSLKRHSLIHSGERPYKCKSCGKGFTQYSILKTHSLIHSGVRPHKCKVCGKDFTVTRSLNRHLLTHKTKTS